MKENEWIKLVMPRFAEACNALADDHCVVRVEAGKKLAYANELARYASDGSIAERVAPSLYATDVLIYDEYPDGTWTPRIVIEGKWGKVTTHDALTYSAKALTHKHVHAHVRYGIVIGCFGNYSLPARLVRHGAHFDFMAVDATRFCYAPSDSLNPPTAARVLRKQEQIVPAKKQLPDRFLSVLQRGHAPWLTVAISGATISVEDRHEPPHRNRHHSQASRAVAAGGSGFAGARDSPRSAIG